jgi:hypothetical protein
MDMGGTPEPARFRDTRRPFREVNSLKELDVEFCRLAIIAMVIGSAMAIGSANLHAQADKSDVGEIGVYAGSLVGPLGGHAAVGGYFGGVFSRYAGAVIDVGYMPLGTRTLVRADQPPERGDLSVLGTDTRGSGLFDFNAALHIRIPIGKKIAPYGLLGGGILYSRYEVDTLLSDETVLHSTFSTSRFGFHTGGGMRFYLTNNVGIRGEVKQTFSTQDFSRILFGIFYQFEEGEF